MYCGKLLTNKWLACRHKKRCIQTPQKKTREDLENEVEFKNSEIEYNKLTTNSDRRSFRSWVTPLYLLNNLPKRKQNFYIKELS